jgi:hypothetical protein
MNISKTVILGSIFSLFAFVFIISEDFNNTHSIILEMSRIIISAGILIAIIFAKKNPIYSGIINVTLTGFNSLFILQYTSSLDFLLMTLCMLTASVFYLLTPHDSREY